MTQEVVFEQVLPHGPEARAAVARYVAELDARFPGGFDAGNPLPLEAFVVGRRGDVVVAGGGLMRLPDESASGPVDEVKRMWVDPDTRGSGVGKRLLAVLEDLARAREARMIRLDTNGTLTEAIAMYDRAGYRRIERYNDNPYAELFFEKEV